MVTVVKPRQRRVQRRTTGVMTARLATCTSGATSKAINSCSLPDDSFLAARCASTSFPTAFSTFKKRKTEERERERDGEMKKKFSKIGQWNGAG